MTADARHDPDFVDRTEAVIRLGSMLLSAGTGAYRVKHAMGRAAEAMGMERHDSAVSLTEITMTTHKGDNFRTVVREVPRVAVDASRIEALEELSRHLPENCSAVYLDSWLDHIARHVRGRWPLAMNLLAAGLACGAFAVLNRFSLLDAALVVPAAACGQAVRRKLAHLEVNQFGIAAIASAVACLCYLLLIRCWRLTPWSALYDVDGTGYVAAILFLIPGFPMMTSILDIARFDFTAGLPRAFYAMTIVFSAGAMAWAVSMVSGLRPLPTATQLRGAWWWIGTAAATGIGIFGFAVLFNSSTGMIFRAALAGMVANVTRLALGNAGMPSQAASFIGGLVVGLLAWLLALRNRLPRITLSVPGAVIMVPGVSMYRTLYWFNVHDTSQAISYCTDAFMGVLALGAGLVVARMLTDPGWLRISWRPSPHAFLTDDPSSSR